MANIRFIGRGTAALFLALVVFSSNSHGGQAVQPGFYSHHPDSVPIRVNEESSGYVCTNGAGPASVCQPSIRIEVTDAEVCDLPGGLRYPCARYGYQYDFQGAEPNATIECSFKRVNPSSFGPRSEVSEYTVELDGTQGHIFRPSFIKHMIVPERVLISEVHKCTYAGEALVNIEFMLNFERNERELPSADDLVAEYGECGEPGFDNFQLSGALPAAAGTVAAPKAGTSWNVTNHAGQMACAGMNMPLTPNQESGSIEVRDDGKTLFAAGFDGDTVDLTMHAVPGITGRYAGSVGGSQDGIPMTIDFCWQVVTDEWITGFLRSEVSTQGVTCKMSRDSELRLGSQ